MNDRRVAVTGIGAVTPLGIGWDATWSAAVKGVSGAGPLSRFDASDFPVRIAAEVDGFEPTAFMERNDARRSDRFTQFAIASAVEACADAGWSQPPYDTERIGVVVGSGIGGLTTLEQQHRVLLERGPSKLSPFCVPLLMLNAASGAIAMRLGLTGPNVAVASACATGAHAIGEATRMIRTGVVDAVLAGGSEAAITPLACGSFASMGALSRRNDEPERASRPFDADRDGFVIGEGAAVLVLEELEAARARGADVLAEVAGYGASADAHHLTQPDPDGAGARAAMLAAMADAGCRPTDVGYINAHGTSTPYNDRIEAAAVRAVFGDRLPAVSSTKSVTGHLLGAAGAVEAAFCVNALRHGVLPPTVNHDRADPECDIDCVPNEARYVDVDVAMSNSFGFGGHNACIVLRRSA